jgi:hypothetical protein
VVAVPDDAAAFGDVVAERLASVLGDDLVGVWFIGSIALGGYVPGESDIDIIALAAAPLAGATKRAVVDAIDPILDDCPSRGLELTVHRPGRGWDVNVNGGPRMERTAFIEPDDHPGFWWTINLAIGHQCGVTIVGPAAATVFPATDRSVLVDAMATSMRWHRANEGATLYSVLNACRAWQFAETGALVSKLAGAAWALDRWHRPATIHAAVELRHGRPASLDTAEVDELLAHVQRVLEAS